jgi:CHRD domain
MKLIRILLAASALTLIAVNAQAATVSLHANLKSSSEVPPNSSKGHGMLNATFDTATNVLTYHAVFSQLSGPATMAHFHGPAPVGSNAKVQVPVTTTPIVSPIDGTATLTPEQAGDLLGGRYYFNVHTAQNPGGEIRGQVSAAN